MKKIILITIIVMFFGNAHSQYPSAFIASVPTNSIHFISHSISESKIDSVVTDSAHSSIINFTPAFYAKRTRNLVELTWQPAIEENKSVFIVQKKNGTQWKSIATVPCSVTSRDDIPSVYTFIDVNSNSRVTQYRISEVGEGISRVSELLTVEPESSRAFNAFYNPGLGKVQINFNTKGTRDIKIYSEKGQLLYELFNVQKLSCEVKVNVSGSFTLLSREQSSGVVTAKKFKNL